MNKLIKLLGDLRSRFWFMLSLMFLLSMAFAVVLIVLDSGGSDCSEPCKTIGRDLRSDSG